MCSYSSIFRSRIVFKTNYISDERNERLTLWLSCRKDYVINTLNYAQNFKETTKRPIHAIALAVKLEPIVGAFSAVYK
jgi:hypothetical protein